jgi:hypothetical protein
MKLNLKIIFFLGLVCGTALAEIKIPAAPLDLRLASPYNRDPLLDGPTHPVYRLRWDAPQKNYFFTPVSQQEFQSNLHRLPFYEGERELFENSRELALAGLSAGGILYFVPQKNLFYWEDRSQGRSEDDSNLLWMSPAITTFVNKLKDRMKADIADNNGRAYGSHRIGSLVMVVLNPAEAFGNHWNAVIGRHVFSQGETLIISKSPMYWTGGAPDDESKRSYIGLRFELNF